MSVRSRIKQLREERGWTMHVLSMRSNVPVAHLHMLEKGIRKPMVETAYKVASAFGLPIEKVFPRDAE
ncbi:MAG TPA: helix-turn-helix transcriptional regulator [Mesotoga infera]|nr:helix-turn-helix transcriptional regulator [Thermotogaceae bacterium]HPD39387.1 helix-turn-helix transcriptional regulator [Mesotoga infera]HRV03202.1 helix-turn-helix transcriptional regulator [Mesotoga sp.]